MGDHDNSPQTDLQTHLRMDGPGVFEHLFNTHWQELYRQAYVRLHDADEAEDVVQDVFADIWSRRDTLVITSSPSSYLRTALKYSIIKRAAKAELRKKSMDHLHQQMEQAEATVLDLLSLADIQQTMDVAIQAFPENMRQVFLLRSEDYTVAEIAAALGLSEQTVKNNTSGALRRLRAVLLEKHPEIPPSFYAALLLFIKT